jgi:hypothetical protein
VPAAASTTAAEPDPPRSNVATLVEASRASDAIGRWRHRKGARSLAGSAARAALRGSRVRPMRPRPLNAGGDAAAAREQLARAARTIRFARGMKA